MGEILNWAIDWRPQLEPTETISSSIWTVSDASALTQPMPSYIDPTGKFAIVWIGALAGARDGYVYQVMNQIVTSTGARPESAFNLLIKPQFAPIV